ncbi:MAG: hypothetical protein PHU85_00425 [Phycisphaerae bacterium]|nr:hypothetical protein [Phycisphaerae bacterium]
MQALTVRRPYADGLVRGWYPVEQRSWFARRTGPCLIHAGRSREWDHRFAWFHQPLPDDQAWGCLLGLVDIVLAFHLHGLGHVLDRQPEFNWLLRLNLRGPICYVVQRPWHFVQPLRWPGAQRFFDVPNDVFAEATCLDPAGHVRRASEYAAGFVETMPCDPDRTL